MNDKKKKKKKKKKKGGGRDWLFKRRASACLVEKEHGLDQVEPCIAAPTALARPCRASKLRTEAQGWLPSSREILHAWPASTASSRPVNLRQFALNPARKFIHGFADGFGSGLLHDGNGEIPHLFPQATHRR
ncbi:MAG: hypothetical protein U1G05_04975 [Kiritimatiellia bacterium]